MNDTLIHTINVNAYDPTRTTSLRNAFVRVMRRRFRELARVVRQAVDRDDVFGLRLGTPHAPVTMQELSSPGVGAFAFPRSVDKMAAFERWLQTQVDRGILEIGTMEQIGVGMEGAWTNRYVFDSYKRGVIRARYELSKAGFSVSSIDQTGGIEISMATPFHIDRLGLLYTRTFSELKGITAQMDQQISRVLAQGLTDGDHPRLLARKLVSTINGTKMGELGITDTLGRFIPAQRRAEMVARTEIIRAHHQATIMEYQNWAVEGIIVKAEISTAGDNRVCAQCDVMVAEGPYTLEVAMNIIPAHPSCRCVALPYKERGVPPVEEVEVEDKAFNAASLPKEQVKTLGKYQLYEDDSKMTYELYESRVGHDGLNSDLRNSHIMYDNLTRVQKKTVNIIDEAFQIATETTEDFKVYRGSDFYGLMKKRGDSFVDRGFLSTSNDKAYAIEFSPNKQLGRITIPRGTSVLDMTKLNSGDYAHEMEWLLPRNGTLQVTKISMEGDVRIIDFMLSY